MKAFLIIFGLLAINIFLLLKFESYILAIILGVVSMVVSIRVLKHNLLKELAVTGAFIGIISSYHFYIQPAMADKFPPFTNSVLIFFGTFVLFRSLVGLGNLIPVPIWSPIAKLIADGW